MHFFTDKRVQLVDEPVQAPAPPIIKSDPLEGFRRYPYVCGGVLDDFRRRARHCGDDYTTAFRHWSKTLSSALFMFFATLFSTVALGAHLQLATDNRIGLSEYLVMNSVAGVLPSPLGAQPPLPEWGVMIANGFKYYLDQWWVAAMPGIAILIVSLGFNLLGDGLRDALDPKESGQ